MKDAPNWTRECQELFLVLWKCTNCFHLKIKWKQERSHDGNQTSIQQEAVQVRQNPHEQKLEYLQLVKIFFSEQDEFLICTEGIIEFVRTQEAGDDAGCYCG